MLNTIEYSSDWSRIIRGNKRFNPDNTNSYKTQCDGNWKNHDINK